MSACGAPALVGPSGIAVERFASLEASRDVEGLAGGPDGGRVGGEEAGDADEDVVGGGRPLELAVLAQAASYIWNMWNPASSRRRA